jgi:hypothetical protein
MGLESVDPACGRQSGTGSKKKARHAERMSGLLL